MPGPFTRREQELGRRAVNEKDPKKREELEERKERFKKREK